MSHRCAPLRAARHALLCLGFSSLFSVLPPALAVAPLASYNVNIADTSVSGLSSGGFMAMQLGVAYSSVFKGVGIFAGGTYDCAGQMNYTGCMYNATPSITQSIANMKSWSGTKIDPVANIANQHVYIFTGTGDTTVGPNVTNQVYNLYVTNGQFVAGANVKYDHSSNASHTFPTDFDGSGDNPCTSSYSPYISNCNFDGAGAALNWIYGTLAARNTGTLGGTLVQFDQTQFITGNGMDTTGWLYVPANCASGQQCKLHVALHGCLQNYQKITAEFLNNTGYNKWADTNNIIIMYPQTIVDNTTHPTAASGSLANPNACWDWIGWYGADFDQKTGVQMKAIVAMVNRIASGFTGGGTGGGGTTIPAAPTSLAVTSATASSVSLSWSSSAGATSYNVYRNGTKVGSATSTAYTDSGLAASTSYAYAVTAVNSAGESSQSNSVTGTTQASATCYTASNYSHVTAGRAHDSGGYALANGSNQNMGLDNVFYTTTLKQTGPNYYVIGTCP